MTEHATLRRVVKAGAALVAALAVWGVAIEPRLLDEVELTVRLPGLPPAWEGARVGLIADPQLGMWLDNEWTVRRAIARLVEERPAAVLLAGDFIYHPLGERDEAAEEWGPEDDAAVRALARRAAELLAPLVAANIPVYAVLGNHDFGMETRHAAWSWKIAAVVTATLRDAGVVVLRNEATRLRGPGGAPLYLVGVGPHWPGRDHVGAALDDLPRAAPRIVLMHNPDSFTKLPAHAAPLALAGHTHGGQIRVPLMPRWSWLSLVEPGRVTGDGWIVRYGAEGNRLYVNRGIGMSTVPVRINCRPELTFIRLRRAGS